jgi:hypothetical protein
MIEGGLTPGSALEGVENVSILVHFIVILST